MNKFSELLEEIARAPECQADDVTRERVRELASRAAFSSDDVLSILDDCVYWSLASDFFMQVLDGVWKATLADEGKSVQQGLKEAEPRRSRVER